jgi:hypothetical protein
MISDLLFEFIAGGILFANRKDFINRAGLSSVFSSEGEGGGDAVATGGGVDLENSQKSGGN